MLTALKNLFKRSEPETHSSKDGEGLTPWERHYIRDHQRCPDCRQGQLAMGPEGGMSVNCMCGRCYHEFNLTFWGGNVMGERISNADQVREDRKPLYGL